MDNFDYLLAAFSIVWVVLFAYIAVLSRRQRRVQREIDRLKTDPRRSPPAEDEHKAEEST
jgi:CcmD family protein